MSIMTESNVYETMGDDGLSEKLCLAACEATNQFMFIPKNERNVEANMYNNQQNVSEEIVEDKSSILNAGVIQDTYDGIGQTHVYYEEAMNACEEVEVDYKPQLSSLLHPSTKMEETWEENNQFVTPNLPNLTLPHESSFEETQMETPLREETEIVEDSDEETIATFLTSAGQRLALYAVEDSDEVFAVAVYDESGEPPSNFQFLMKSDVERLIGEGAVRTVKKPTQMKKQLINNDPPVFTQQQQTQPQQKQQESLHQQQLQPEQPQLVQQLQPQHQQQREPLHQQQLEPQPQQLLQQHEPEQQQLLQQQQPEQQQLLQQQQPEQPQLLHQQEPQPSLQQKEEEMIFEDPQSTNDATTLLQYQNDQFETHNTTIAIPQAIEITPTSTPLSTWNDDAALQSTEPVQDTEIKSSPLPDADEQPSVTYVLMEETGPVNNSCAEAEDSSDKNGELVEQSTVQCIFFENEQSDAELTFDDIVETMKCFKPNASKSLLKKSSRILVEDLVDNNPSFNGAVSDVSLPDSPTKVDPPPNTEINNANRTNTITKTYKNPTSTRKSHSSLICRRENFIDERFNISGTSLLISNAEAKNSTESKSAAVTIQASSKVKRPRKQQLTSVNRGDSEIIIQPATFPSEENETTKKRGRGRRKGTRTATHKTKAVITKKITRTRRPRPVEVIEIDVDEDEIPQAKKKDIVEITIDENKEKGSSDKENEVIMVGDSDDEEEEAGTSKIVKPLLKCDHCARSFRQKRALETHSRVCPKSPDTVRRLTERSKRRSSTRSNDSPVEKKQYTCKICQEKFDVVVALARHVRSMHSQRKKMYSTHQSTPVNKSPESQPKIVETPKKNETTETSTTATPTRKRKTKTKNSNRSWKAKKLHCDDCGRWFSSDASLSAHCLQHATKKSEKQMRRCQTCKKIFKSRLLYIRHMRMHSRVKQLQKKLHHTRQATSKLTALRKRGRPRKL